MGFQALKKILQNIEGSWISYRTVYSIASKRINSDQMNLDIRSILSEINSNRRDNKHISQLIYLYKYNLLKTKTIVYYYLAKIIMNSGKTEGLIYKINQNNQEQYKFTFTNSILQIKGCKKGISFTENIYFLNKKFKISIIIMKKNNILIAICFNSYIKINN